MANGCKVRYADIDTSKMPRDWRMAAMRKLGAAFDKLTEGRKGPILLKNS